MFAQRLRELRLNSDLKQSELAKVINISSSTIGMYEQGRRSPDLETLNKLCNYFDVSTDYILGNTDEVNSFNLNQKEENTPKDIEKMIDELMEQQGLMLCGEPMSETDIMLLRNSIRSTIELAKTMRNKK